MKTPGTYKSKATFEPDTKPLPKIRDKAFNDSKVEDEEYDYTKSTYPGFVGSDPNLTRAENLHVRHMPGR